VYEMMRGLPQGVPERRHWWLRRAAEGGDAQAKFHLAERVISTHRRPPEDVSPYNNPEAVQKLLFDAATADVVAAQLQLARFYLGELHVIWKDTPIDALAGVEWYRRAAEQQRDREAARAAAAELGHLYYEGTRIERDYAQAHRWYVRADAAQVRPCSYLSRVRLNLIRMYSEGLGVPMDPQKAAELRKFHQPCI
jgi:TPR repeat protein